MSQKARHHHTGTDYWFMTPVSNPDNTTQELPLSLAVTDKMSNCRSTSTSQRRVETNQHHTCRSHTLQTYNSNSGVRVSRTDDTDLNGTHSTGTNPEHNKHKCLAHTEPEVPDCRGRYKTEARFTLEPSLPSHNYTMCHAHIHIT
ncbi:hypothetical protein Taro_043348 [Colocasia esculenta]|uniref:Uncharacterized protein n=1 Tax=Colocasia esculenta TaxID=4460 RepID=A0A843X1B7_COLES|nr:hypothetical protein [Colocasia esculenta]